jgi:16S rRNA (guanine527-N7)-methyltransferase
MSSPRPGSRRPVGAEEGTWRPDFSRLPKPGNDPDPALLAEDRSRAIALMPVSRETLARLDHYAALLLQWQKAINLVAASTLSTLWTRHIADSLQLLDLAPNALKWVDFGSGAGFPGLVVACALAEKPDAGVALVEANRKKAAFLRQAIAATGAPALVHHERIAAFVTQNREQVDVVTARALAPLDLLLEAAEPLVKNGAQALFPKGQDAEAELTQASRRWILDAVLVPSKTDPRGRIVHVKSATRRPGAA